MAKLPMNPLLSICIPTYNRVHLLETMLEVLIPQARAHAREVEIVVSDNASTDSTPTLLEKYSELTNFTYSRNAKNEGMVANFVKGPVELANGKFIWLMGDHNLMNPGTLDYLIPILKERQYLSILYPNFQCARYPEQWPKNAEQNFAEKFEYLANEDLVDKKIKHWHELIQPHSALCTQIYAHIIKRSVWIAYWKNRKLPKVFENAEGTYPHTYMITKMVFDEPSYYLGKPLITIYNGAQHWGNLEQKIKVYLNGLPELIELYQHNGLTTEQVRKAQKWNKTQIKTILPHFLNSHDNDKRKILLKGIIKNIFHPYLLSQIINSFVVSRCCIIAKFMYWIIQTKNQTIQYVFYNCRPARWVRNKKSFPITK